MDVGAIEIGMDFVEAIETAVGQSDLLLAVIGKRWLSATDAEGRRRLDDPHDFVRLEIATALARNIRVVPVLVQGGTMPSAETLPPDLERLARRQAAELRDASWRSDVARLTDSIERLLNSTRQASAQDAGVGRDAATNGGAGQSSSAAYGQESNTMTMAQDERGKLLARRAAASKVIRCDGLYIEAVSPGERSKSYLRFYEDGTVLESTISVRRSASQDPHAIFASMDKSNPDAPKGTFAVEGNSIQFTIKSLLIDVTYSGTLSGNGLDFVLEDHVLAEEDIHKHYEFHHLVS
jgi:hypothetical protein